MYEITVGDTVYPFNFGMGFLREINKCATSDVPGVNNLKANVGLRYSVMQLIDGDVEALVRVLDAANKGQNPRITIKKIEEFIDDENTNIDVVFDEVMGFLKTANATKKATLAVFQNIEETLNQN